MTRYKAEVECANEDDDVCDCVSHIEIHIASTYNDLLNVLKKYYDKPVLKVVIYFEED